MSRPTRVGWELWTVTAQRAEESLAGCADRCHRHLSTEQLGRQAGCECGFDSIPSSQYHDWHQFGHANAASITLRVASVKPRAAVPVEQAVRLVYVDGDLHWRSACGSLFEVVDIEQDRSPRRSAGHAPPNGRKPHGWRSCQALESCEPPI